MKLFSKNCFFIGLLLLSVVLNTCATENKPTYLLTVDVSPQEAGVVTQSSIEAQEGESIQVTATPNEHWVFLGWSGDISGADQPTVYVFMDSDRNVTALFEKKEYPLTVEVEGEGVVKEEIIQQKSTDYPHGTLVKLSAQPEYGWKFSHWAGDASSEEDEIEVLIEGETNIKAVFQLKIFDLNIEIEGNGSVEEKEIQAKSSEYPFGTIVELSAVPDYGWEFVRWEGDVEDAEDPVVQLLIDSDKEVKAIFERADFTLTLAIEGEGTVEQEIVQAKSTEYTFETDVKLTATPETGWEFVEWRGDYEGTNTQIIITIDEDKEIEAVFKRQDFQLTIQVNGQGTVNQEVISQAKTQSYTYSTEVQLSAIPGEGWVFSSWTGDASGSQDLIVVSMDNDKHINANFDNITHQLSIQVSGQGNVFEEANQGGQGTYPFGTNVLLTAVPADGWVFAGWSGSVVSKHNPVEVEMSQNKTVTVNFVQVPSQKRILPLGDSITNGFPHSYRYFLYNMLVSSGYSFNYVGSKNTNPANYPGSWDTRHEGNNGATSKAINSQLEHWLQYYYTVDIALIHLGTNDVTNSIAQPNEFQFTISYMESIIKNLRADNPVVRIYLAKIIPFDSTFDSIYNQRVNEWNNWIQNLRNRKSTAVSPIYIVDMNSNFGDNYFEDGFHPNEAGAEEMGNRWLQSLIGN